MLNVSGDAAVLGAPRAAAAPTHTATTTATGIEATTDPPQLHSVATETQPQAGTAATRSEMVHTATDGSKEDDHVTKLSVPTAAESSKAAVGSSEKRKGRALVLTSKGLEKIKALSHS